MWQKRTKRLYVKLKKKTSLRTVCFELVCTDVCKKRQFDVASIHVIVTWFSMTSMRYKIMQHDVSSFYDLIGWMIWLCIAHARLLQGAFGHVTIRRHVEELADTIMERFSPVTPTINWQFINFMITNVSF